MMAKKDRLPRGYSASLAPRYESEASGSSGRFDSIEDSSASKRKWIDLNSASRDGFTVPIQIIPLAKLSSVERKSLVVRLTSELEHIRLLQNKVESQKKKTGNNFAKSNSSDILGGTNGQQRGMQVSNMKKSVGLASAPGKKGRGWNRGITGRFESSSHKPHVNLYGGILKQCDGLLKKLMSQQYAWVFNTPVDVVKLNIPDYFDIIKNPMDLGTVKGKLNSGKYSSPFEFLADVRLTFSNAKTYNPPGTDVHIIAETLRQFFESRWKAIEKKLEVTLPQSAPEKAGVIEGTVASKTLAPSKKRKLSPRQHEVIQEPIKRKMTDEEKHKLSMELEGFDGDLPDAVIDFLRAQTSNRGDGGEDEIEIDIDDLSDDTLFTLRKLLDEHLPQNQKNLDKSEACEIELPNVSGLSNSSLQVDKGNDNDPIDEDVDIGGNEAPVTSYPPVLIEKDGDGRAEEYNEAGPDSDRGSDCSKDSLAVKQEQDDICHTTYSAKQDDTGEVVGEHTSASELDQLEHGSVKPCSSDSDGQVDGEGVHDERPVSPDKQYRAAILKNRFLDTILKAREKTLTQDEKMDPEKLRREREELEMHKKREKARLQAEAKAAEDARKRAEAEAAAEEKRRRELEREAAREALLKMEKTVEINENSRFLEDLEMLSAAPEQLPSSVDETSPEHSQDGFGSFKFGSNNPLEQLGLYMKMDDDEEEAEPPSLPNAMEDTEVDDEETQPLSLPKATEDAEEGDEEEAELLSLPKATEDAEEGEID